MKLRLPHEYEASTFRMIADGVASLARAGMFVAIGVAVLVVAL